MRFRFGSLDTAILLVTFMLILGACTSPQPIVVVATNTPVLVIPTSTSVPTPTPIPYKDTIVIGITREPRTLHPLLDDDPTAIHILDAIYERYITSIDFAYQANPNGGLMADLPTLENGGATLDDGGTPNDPVDDQLTVVFKMQSGPTWCDGEPVTAKDSVYAFNLAADPDSGVASRAAIDKVASYTALDDTTIEAKLKPGQLDPNYMTYFWTPLPEHVWGRYTALELQTAAEAARRPCGYGPYTIAGAEDRGAGWIAGDSVTLVANPHYFRGAPRTPRLVFKFVPGGYRLLTAARSGELDIAVADDAQSMQLPDLAQDEARGLFKLVAVRSPVWEQLIFNLYAPTNFDSNGRAQPHPILGDARVRQAIAYAVNRPALVDRVYAGRSSVMNEPLLYENHPLYTPDDQITAYPFDPGRAAALLDAAGWRDTDNDGVRECRGCTSGAEEDDRLALTYHTTSSDLRDRAVVQIAGDLRAVGFEIMLERLPTNVLFGDVTGLIVGDFEIVQMAGVTDADPGGERQYGCDWIALPDNGWYGENYSGWCNDTASQALFEAGHTLLLDARRAAYAAFTREYTRDLPGLPLFPRLDVFIVNPRLENFQPRDFMPSATWNAYALAALQP